MEKSPQSFTTEEASKLLKQFGLNEIAVKQRKNLFSIFISQFTSLLIILLIISSLISFVFRHFLDGSFILAIIIINGILGFVQEYKAEKALQKLKTMTLSKTQVIRDGIVIEIESKYLVPGDIINLGEGEKIPADAILIESKNIEVDESALTGESIPVYKHTENEKSSLLYLGTTILKGHCKARVTCTGMQTKFGKIAQTLSLIKDEATPLEKKLSILGRELTLIGVIGSIAILISNLFYKHSFFDGLLVSISIAVACVPEGLPAVITIALASGVSKMAKRNAVVRKMSAIETLGATTLIATDKTGTLTQNQMQVVKIWTNDDPSEIALAKLLEICVLCNNAKLGFEHEKGRNFVIGDTTEGALLLFAKDKGVDINKIRLQENIINEFSFDTKTRMMSVLVKHEQDGIYVLTKGAPENLLKVSTKILRNGKVHNLTLEEKRIIEEKYLAFAQKGLRIIAFGYKKITENKKEFLRSQIESDLIFVGFAGIADPVRKGIKEAINLTRNAGIETVMITGDNEVTADAIASEIGLIRDNEEIITGEQFDALSEKEKSEILPKIRIFARCTPEHKFNIVKAYQHLGHIVAVTGDGINDVLALKQAEVGVAMGISGTDIAKDASDVVILDDNYASIVAAVEEGRVIFDNIVKSVSYLIIGNISEIFTILFAVIVGLPSPLLPIQILWMNLITDGLPAVSLAVDTKHPNIMKRKPNSLRSTLLTQKQLYKLFSFGISIAFINVLIYWILLMKTDLIFARTCAFSLLIISQMFLVFFVSGSKKWYSNKFILLTVVISLFLQILILTVPLFKSIFHVGF